MARPPLAIGTVVAKPVQGATAIGLQIIQYSLRGRMTIHDHVHVIGPHMRGEEIPAAMQTNILK